MYEFSLDSIPADYKPVYADNNYSYVITNQNTAVNVPAHGTGDGRIATFAGGTSAFDRLIFDNTVANNQNLITVLHNGRVRVQNGYKIVVTRNPTPREIESTNNPVGKTAAGSTSSKKAGPVGITCRNGATENFPRCVFKAAAAAAGGAGQIVLPANCHFVVMSTVVNGIPVVSEINTPVNCIEAGNNPGLHIGITAHGATNAFPRLVLSDPVPLPDNAVVPDISMGAPVADDPLYNFALDFGNPPALKAAAGNNNVAQAAHAAFWQPPVPAQPKGGVPVEAKQPAAMKPAAPPAPKGKH